MRASLTLSEYPEPFHICGPQRLLTCLRVTHAAAADIDHYCMFLLTCDAPVQVYVPAAAGV